MSTFNHTSNKLISEPLLKETVHVAFICDEHYVMPTAVAITSIYMNKKHDVPYHIHILASDISIESITILESLSKEFFHIEILDLCQSETMKDCAIQGLHVSTAALYKFNLPKLFPSLHKILYLDGDILVQKDLFDLYNTDLSDLYAAVVKDYKPMTYNPPQVVKLAVEHKCYFNSGVMLLNLDKLREDNMPEKLLDYRLHGINYFMDQDTLNVVFQEKVKYISLLNNVMSSVMGFFSFDDIKNYYHLDDISCKEDIYKQATIVHLCTKYKPWSYYNVPFADEWLVYYSKANFSNKLERKRLTSDIQRKLFAELGYSSIISNKLFPYSIVVSLTSFPGRIHLLSQVIQSLLNQTILPDKILLWLAESQFPEKELMLPSALLELVSEKFEIRWCDDLKPHKKYYYTMLEYPDSIVITVDDDVEYSNTLIELLLNSYSKFPFAVSAMRAHLITFEEDGTIAPYSKWKREFKYPNIPSLALCATGVGGVLYPPRIMSPELFNKNAILQNCLEADDLWLKIMQTINNTPVVVATPRKKIAIIEDSQNEALWKTNDSEGRNDVQLVKILDEYDNFWSEKDRISQRIFFASGELEQLIRLMDTRKLRAASKELKDTQSSLSYRIGRFITFIPRKIWGGIKCCQDHGIIYTVKYSIYKTKTVFGWKGIF